MPKSSQRQIGLENNMKIPMEKILMKVLLKQIVSSDMGSTHFRFKWRDAGRAFSILKLVKK